MRTFILSTALCLLVAGCGKELDYDRPIDNYLNTIEQITQQVKHYEGMYALSPSQLQGKTEQQAQVILEQHSSKQFVALLQKASMYAAQLKEDPHFNTQQLRLAFVRHRTEALMEMQLMDCRSDWSAARSDCDWDYAKDALGCLMLGAFTGPGGVVCSGLAIISFVRCGNKAYQQYLECRKTEVQ